MSLDHTWGDRWLEMAASGSVTARRRLDRGRQGAGRLVDLLRVEDGVVRVRVPDGRGRSHDATVAVPPIDDDTWASIVERLGGALRHTATLLEGHLPSVLHDLPLVPASVDARCTCTEPQPCRHVSAAHHALATAMVRDPFRVLQVRGRSRDELLDALRTRRGGARGDEVVAIDLAHPTAARGDLDAIAVHPVPEPDVDLLFQQLGTPPGLEEPDAIADLMYEAAALAWKLAAGEGADVADDEALLAELRAQGVAGAASLAEALGLDGEAVREALDRLYERGTVLRVGSGEGARYRAAQ